jgi:hypothetical protein
MDFIANHKHSGNHTKKGNQPPKKRRLYKTLIKMIFMYSAIKKNANPTAEYSTLYPATNSPSASGKSKGGLLVSAKIEMKNKTAAGNTIIKLILLAWLITISVKLKDPVLTITISKIKPIDTS